MYNNEHIVLLSPKSSLQGTFLFAEEQINVATGFQIRFTFVAKGEPEGFAFLLHRRPEGLNNFPLSSGPSLGFKGCTHSVAVAFDLCTDRSTGTCVQQEVSIRYPSKSTEENKHSSSRKRVYDPILRSLKLGDQHEVRIDYLFRPKVLQVTIDDSLYLREFPFDPVQVKSIESAKF